MSRVPNSWFALSRTRLSPTSLRASVSPWPSRRRSPQQGAVEAGGLAGLRDPRPGAPSLIISPRLSPPRSS